VARNARRQLARAGHGASSKLSRLVADLETTIQRTDQIVGQTRIRLAGQTPDCATRLVSLHDPDARPIVKGRLGKPVEFGYKAQVVDNPDGIERDRQGRPSIPDRGEWRLTPLRLRPWSVGNRRAVACPARRVAPIGRRRASCGLCASW
jgi:hypothetical protein